jgi:hypothetical protein
MNEQGYFLVAPKADYVKFAGEISSCNSVANYEF